MIDHLVMRPTRIGIIKAVVQIVQAEGPLPAAAIHSRLWDMNIHTSRGDVIGALRSPQGISIFSSYPRPLDGGRNIRRYYYLIDQEARQ